MKTEPFTYVIVPVKTGYIASSIYDKDVSAFATKRGKPLEKVLKQVAKLYAEEYPDSKIADIINNKNCKFVELHV